MTCCCSVDTIGGLPGIVAEAPTPMIAFGNDSTGSSPTTRFLEPWYFDGLAETDGVDNARIVMLRPGTLRVAALRHGDPAGNGNDIVYTVRVNAIATALSITLASTGVLAFNLTDQLTVVLGDLVDVEVTKAGSTGQAPGNITFQMELAA